MSGRAWTDDDVAVLKQHYATKPASWIARRVGRSTSAVLQKAESLGLLKNRVRHGAWRAEIESWLRSEVDAGRTDAEIAEQWNALGRWHVNRRTIAYYRQVLRIELGPIQQAKRLEQRRWGHRLQLAVLRARTFGGLHKRRLRREAIAAGWPLDCSRFECRVLDLMADGRQRTKREIALALGCPLRSSRDTLQTRKGCHSVLANLVRRGLLSKSRGRPVRGEGKGSAYCTWWLSAKAIIYHARCTRRRWVG